ncbi:MAG TPA: hypothetical protein VFU23_12350 [Gemmatimonadales bacterium]|nr:hypothetical protein [Gemmatimonadales bacterium]
MRTLTRWTRLATVAVLATAGCKSLEVTNPNNPDASRAFSDPGAVAGLVTGAVRNWVQVREAFDGPLVLATMADGYTASWNNFNLRYYTSFGNECPARCGWDNVPTSNFRFEVETIWFGFYGLLSSVNDVLTAIRTNHVTIADVATTKTLEAASVMVQGVVFANIAMHYDQGFVVTEATDLSNPLALPLVTRAVLRDSAIAKFDQAIALLNAAGFSGTPSTWLGATNGPSYSSAQLVKLVKTMQAEVLAMYPRNAAENATVNWGQVATYAAAGLSSGTPLDVTFYSDQVNMVDGEKNWSNDITTMRVDTRLAHNITNGPNAALIHHDPWPDPAGNPQPNAFDQRVGNGSWGPSQDFLGVGTVADDGNGGSDFAYAGVAIFRAARGQYHQSNLGQIRYSYLAYPGYGLPTEDGKGLAPVYTATLNDLLWAEGLIRSGGNAAQAAALINKTRVTRGGLAALTGAEGTAALLAALQYEQDVELLGLGSEPYFNRRRIDGLLAMTPRQMPIPAKELAILKKEFYSFGGPGNPAGLAPPVDDNGMPIVSVRERGEALVKANLLAARRHRHD